MSAIALVQSITEEMATGPSLLPTPAKYAFNALLFAHRAWRWIRLGKIYSNPDNFLNLAAGHGLNAIAGDSTLVRISAIAVMIATRILDSVEAFDDLQISWKKMRHALRNEYQPLIPCTWEVKTGFFSGSTILWFKTTSQYLFMRIQWISLSLLNMGKKALILCMRLMDAVDCFSMSPSLKQESVNLLFVNGSHCLEKLVEQKETLISGLENNSELIQKVLNGLNSSLTADTLIASVNKGLNHVENFHHATKKANEGFGEAVKAIGKKWAYEFLFGIRLHHLVPKTMVPPALPPWEQPERVAYKNRMPPLAKLKAVKV